MSIENKPQKKAYRSRQATLTIDCSAEQKKKVIMLAASKKMSITDFILYLVEKYSFCPLGLSHIPNIDTIASIEASERGEDIKSFNSMDDLFKDLGI